MNNLINIFNNNLQRINIEEINFDSLFKNYEKYINNNIIDSKEKERNELNKTLLNLFEINYGLNEYYLNLIKDINLENYNNEKICEIIDYIIEKKRYSIVLLEQFKNKIDDENELINDNNNDKITEYINKNIYNFTNDDNNKISFPEIQLNNFIYDKQNKNINSGEVLNDKNVHKKNNNYNSINYYSIKKILKRNFTD